MTRYQTEIVIAADRQVTLQLPDELPEGRATVTIIIHDTADTSDPGTEFDDESQDIEWWEEFEDDYERVG